MQDNTFRTSEEWFNEVPKEYGLTILKYEGWDTRHFNFSFYEEEITKEHFIMRVEYSIYVTSAGLLLKETQWALDSSYNIKR